MVAEEPGSGARSEMPPMGGLAGRGGTRAPSACARRILRVVPVPIKDYTSLSWTKVWNDGSRVFPQGLLNTNILRMPFNGSEGWASGRLARLLSRLRRSMRMPYDPPPGTGPRPPVSPPTSSGSSSPPSRRSSSTPVRQAPRHPAGPRHRRALWTVFDPVGRILGFVETPDGLEIYEIGEDYILGRRYRRCVL